MRSKARRLALVLTTLMGVVVVRVAAAEGPAVLATRCDARTVGLYEKFELRIDLRANNALWAGVTNGLCATPFWWAHAEQINDSVITNQMLHFARFVADIDFANAPWEPAAVTAGECDAWAMKSDKLVFAWIVNPKTSVAGESLTVSGLKDGDYEVRLYHTWRGTYLEPQAVQCREGKLSVTIPELKTTGGHASHIGHDVALKIVPK